MSRIDRGIETETEEERERERERTPGRLGIAINQGLSGIRLPADPTTRLLKVSQGLNINPFPYLRHPIQLAHNIKYSKDTVQQG